jgi:glycosyltransferase involved in cell wall biosynthesis
MYKSEGSHSGTMAVMEDTEFGVGKARPLRVLSIAHSAFLDGSSRLRYYPLAGDERLQLTVLTPDRWSESGREFKRGSHPGPIDIRPEKILLRELPRVNWYLHFYPSLGRLIKELLPDVLHLWEEPWSVVALQATRLRQRCFPNVALVLETEQNILRRLPQPFESIRRYTLRHTDLLIARQQEALDVSRACGYTGPASFVDYAVDRTCFTPGDSIAARREFQVDGFTVGYVGRLVREKGLFTVLDALKSCRQPVCFLMMGDGPARSELNDTISKLGLEGRVRILPSQPQERVARFMNAVDVLALMSITTRTWKEQFGRVIVEAQACGLPVIGSTSGSIPSVVGGGGWIVEESDSKTLADLLDRLALHPEETKIVPEKALRNVNRFSTEVVSGSLRRAYLEAARYRQQTAFGG